MNRPALLSSVLLLAAQTGMAQEANGPLKQNWFDDPFFQVSAGLPACAMPEGPFYTAEERRMQTHSRLERGTSCWLAGKCTDSNAYRYDKPLAPKVRAALLAVPGVNKGSVWVMIQRRWVYLQGCVPNAALAKKLERAARALPDVETVVPDLMVGPRGKPPYPVATAK
ncbi:BON domain-containing protein [Variovorax sp. YR634]|uniref:BON domain-containing protein n=1 Tax=Variovorax sp. YR634 TaxID=1884385 RepID=UPI00089D794D|nr:BON domain-containing protein [Variovorax sp. YR634]SDY41269.1 BON domain-containing protein [Variovorax sp. YR634]